MAMDIAEIRRKNLSALLGIYSTQDAFGKRIGFTSNQITDWKLYTEMTDAQAREIEKKLEKPQGWMDRDNNSINLSAQEFELILELRAFKPNIQESLLGLIKAMSHG
jgi:hypothetical protein